MRTHSLVRLGRSLLLSFCAGGLIFAAPSPTAAGGIVSSAFLQVEFEPNDSYSLANAVEGQIVQAEISKAGENDYFSVLARKGDVITAGTVHGETGVCADVSSPNAIDSEIEILDVDGTTSLALNYDVGPWFSDYCSLATTTVYQTGRYFIRVSSDSWYCPSCLFDYGLLVSLSPAPEENDTGPDPPCNDDSGNRYVPCGNGTVTDNQTGLVWTADANCIKTTSGEVNWQTASEFVAGLADLSSAWCASEGLTNSNCDCGLDDGSSPGDWRLPTAEEWQTMVASGDSMGCSPTLTNDQGSGCYFPPFVCASSGTTCSFANVTTDEYWSQTVSPLSPTAAWYVDLTNGDIDVQFKTSLFHVWPVRDGQ